MNRELVKKKYKLHLLRDIENYVADKVSVQVPFNNYVTGYCAFTHKAGIHAKAILNNPETYEVRGEPPHIAPATGTLGHTCTATLTCW